MTDTDTERDERLRAARNVAAFLRAQEPDARAMGLSEGERAVILALDDAVARLDAVVTAVREVHSLHKATRLPGGGYEWSCDECGADLDSDDDTCPTVRALDGGAR